ncbi:hypothetical protein ACFQ14_12575 [Pseudahrensia aquimaris]|uniref:Uncharacterized protein n=1 Tax=Pseudahrensia aquimaris TaxID=744461 RepID=A0ABW3FM76_9HYPH
MAKEGENNQQHVGEYLRDLELKVDFRKYNRVGDVPEFLEYAEYYSWKNRVERGFKKREDFFHFLKDRYERWINAAKQQGVVLTQADLKAADKAAWERLQQDIRRYKLSHPEIMEGKMPNGLYLPNLKVARLHALDPKDRERLEESRRLTREAKALERSLSSPKPS